MSTVLFILILLIVSGIVAWAGDTLGRVLGKRRIALFNLRPRRTSLLIAILTGILITGCTIFILYLANANIRYALDNMDRIRREIETLNTARDEAIAQRDDALMLVETAHSDLAIAESVVGQLKTEQQFYTGQISTLQSDVDLLRVAVEVLANERESLTAQVGRLESEMEAIIAEREVRVAELEDEINTNLQIISNQENRMAWLDGEISRLNRTIDDLTQELQSFALGDVKVYEGQLLVTFSIDTLPAIQYIYSDLQLNVDRIPNVYLDPVTGEAVLADNSIEVTSVQYNQAIEAIRAVNSDKAIIIIYATENVVEDQPVPVRIEVTHDFKVYSQASLIYSNSYTEPSVGVQQPYRATLAQFFEDARNSVVNDRSLIPITSGEALQMTIDDYLDLAEILADVGFPAEIRIIALTDIYRTDFLVYGDQFTVSILPVTTTMDGVDPE